MVWFFSIFLSFLCSCLSEEERKAVLFYAEQERLLAGALSPDKEARLQVHAFSSWDLKKWEKTPEPVAHSFSSLGLQERDSRLFLSGQHRLRLPTAEEEASGHLWTQALVFDGDKWQAQISPFLDPDIQAHSDHQRFGDQIWYFATSGKHREFDDKGVDPMSLPRNRDPMLVVGDHLIRSSPPGKTWVKGPGLADPSPVSFQSKLHLFSTRLRGGRVSVVHHHGPDLQKSTVMPRVSVPFARQVGSQLWLLAQKRFEGVLQPVLSISNDARSWSPWAPIIEMKGLKNCTSPVFGELKGRWWLFCVEER